MPVQNIYDTLSCILKTELILMAAPLQRVNKNRYEVTQFALLYTNICMGILLSLIMIAIFLKLRDPSGYLSLFDGLSTLAICVGCLEIFMSIFTFTVSNLSHQFKKYEHIDLIENLKKIDDCLIREFKAKMNYLKIFRKTCILVGTFTLYFMAVSLSVLVKLIGDDWIYIPVIGICYMFIYMTPGISTYAAMTYADLLRIRFRLLQKLLDSEYLTKRYADENERSRKFGILVRCYQDMFKIIEKISSVYGISLLVVHFHDFTMTTTQLYFIYWKSTDGTDNSRFFIQFIIWMLPTLWKSIFMPLYMHLMLNEADTCIPLIRRADDHTPTDETKGIIQTFTLWNRHKTTHVSVAGFFVSDLTLGFAILSAVASYLLVLIQFKMQEEF